jgi:hypothetical protein
MAYPPDSSEYHQGGRGSAPGNLPNDPYTPAPATNPMSGLGSASQGAMQGAGIGTMVAPGWGTAIGAGIGGLAAWLGSRRGDAPDPRTQEQMQAAQYYRDLLSGEDQVGLAAMRRGQEEARLQGAGMIGSARGMTPQQASLMASQQQHQGMAQSQADYMANLERARSGAASGLAMIGGQVGRLEQQEFEDQMAARRKMWGEVGKGSSAAVMKGLTPTPPATA